MKKIALLLLGGLIVSAAFQQGYAEASKREPALRAAWVIAPAHAGPAAKRE